MFLCLGCAVAQSSSDEEEQADNPLVVESTENAAPPAESTAVRAENQNPVPRHPIYPIVTAVIVAQRMFLSNVRPVPQQHVHIAKVAMWSLFALMRWITAYHVHASHISRSQ